jgi:outer membrane protein OmpA-like peptidoglycan-associated protein
MSRGRILIACLAIAPLLAACGGDAPLAGDAQPTLTLRLPNTDTPAYPRVTDVPGRPENLPTEDELADRQRRLEADRDAALGNDGGGTQPPAGPEPIPELTETLQHTPVERPPSGLVEVARSGVSVQIATVYFPSDSVDLDEQMIDVLSQVAREQQSIGGGIRIVGHAGPAASEDLARRQMATVGQTLVRMGVPPTRIDTELAVAGGNQGGDHGRAVIYLDY